MEEVGEQETDELEGHGNHGIPEEAEKRADGEAFDKDLVAKGAGGEDGGFPVGRCCVSGGLFICLGHVSIKCIFSLLFEGYVPAAFPRRPPLLSALRSGLPIHHRFRHRRRARCFVLGG